MIKEGLLWFSNDNIPLEGKVIRAITRYHNKYDRQPTVCFMNPNEIEIETIIDGVRVAPLKIILPFHFWLGVEECANI